MFSFKLFDVNTPGEEFAWWSRFILDELKYYDDENKDKELNDILESYGVVFVYENAYPNSSFLQFSTEEDCMKFLLKYT